MRKITFLAVSLLALMAISGYAYAFWSDGVEVRLRFETGTFGWELSYIETCLWGDTKNLLEDGDGYLDGEPLFDAVLTDYVDGHPKTLVIELGNWISGEGIIQGLYPGTKLEPVWDLHFYGTVPGDLTDVDVECYIDDHSGSGKVLQTTWPEWLTVAFRILDEWWTEPEPFDPPVGVPTGSTWLNRMEFISALENSQWHESNSVCVMMNIQLIENGDYPWKDCYTIGDGVEPPQGVQVSIIITIDGVQYNFDTAPSPLGVPGANQ